MSILTVKDNGLAAKARQVKMNKGIEHAAKVLHESCLARRCPNLVKGIESESKDAKYQAATLVQLIENTANYYASEQGVQLLQEDFGAASTNAVSLLSPGVATLTPQVIDVVNRL